MAIPLSVDRKIAYHPVSALSVSTGRSGQVESYLASRVKNPTITLIGESVTPVIETPQLSLSYSTPIPTSEIASISLVYSTEIT